MFQNTKRVCLAFRRTNYSPVSSVIWSDTKQYSKYPATDESLNETQYVLAIFLLIYELREARAESFDSLSREFRDEILFRSLENFKMSHWRITRIRNRIFSGIDILDHRGYSLWVIIPQFDDLLLAVFEVSVWVKQGFEVVGGSAQHHFVTVELTISKFQGDV
jgi:hypothetical protein